MPLLLTLLLAPAATAGLLDKAKDAVGLETPAAAPALPEPTYWFNPTETLIFRDQLYYSAFANHLREGQRLTLTLEGPGAPAEPLVSVTARKDDEDFSERWLSFSSGGLGANKQGLPIEGLSAGDYTLRMRVDGAEVAAQPFALIEVPTALGATALQVDPRERAWRPYVTGPYVLMWVPVDLTMGLEAYRAYWWADGEYLGDTVTAPEVPRLSLGASELGDVPLFSLAPVVLRKKQDVGALDVALSHNEADVLGAARWVNTWDPRVVEGVDPGVSASGSSSPVGLLTLAAPSSAQAETVDRVRGELASRPRDPDFKAPRGLSEPQACALYHSAEARQTYRSLLSLREEYGDAVWSTWNALQAKKDPHASAEERKLAQEAMNRGAGNQAAYKARVEEVAARFDRQTAPYAEGCLEALRPEGYARIAEVPTR
ncbi:MAG: hypothetical protein H6740_28945 [Alphaproteobacteria bacterium]|nr:hypothetical protein [Alphaproteobacteria bacterium]